MSNTIVEDVVQEIFDELYNNGQHDVTIDNESKWDDIIKQEIDYVVDSAQDYYVESLIVHYAMDNPSWLTYQLKDTSSLRIILHNLLSEEIERVRKH